MPHASFVHLDVHSTYSLLESACRTQALVEEARRLGMPALALTDTGNLFGAVEFYRAALAGGIKPIIGMEILVEPDSGSGAGSILSAPSRETGGHESYLLGGSSLESILLLVKDERGYRNLCRLSSEGFLARGRGLPRVSLEDLSRRGEGLIALAGGNAGPMAAGLLRKDQTEARRFLTELQSVFAEKDLYLRISDHGLERERILNQGWWALSESLRIPVVAGNEVRYLHQKDARAHDVLLCVKTGCRIDEKERPRLGSDQYYLKSAEEMAEYFFDHPESLSNTLRIAERCNFAFEFGKARMPRIPLPEGFEGDEAAYLRREAEEGLLRRYGTSPRPEVKERLNYELDVIIKKGYAGYILIVADFIRYAREQGIPVGPGRGSGAASLVCYTLGITDVDPLKYGLIFERFLNPERMSLPDIDVDFCQVRRDEVIEYVRQKYGSDRVAQIIAFGTMKARNALRDVARVYGIPPAAVDRFAKMIPFNESLAHAVSSIPELREAAADARYRDLFETAQSLEGLVRHASTHAAGVIIAGEPLAETVPLYQDESGRVMTQYEMNSLEKLGFPKTDFLGLRNLTLIAEAECLIARRGGVPIDWSAVSLNDSSTYKLLRAGRTLGVFQLDSPGMRDLVRKMEPARIEDLIAVQALYRPGALSSGATEAYIRRKKGEEPVDYLHPLLEPILKETYGSIIYQEQVLQIAHELADIPLEKADELRRAMGKKVPEVMGYWQESFLKGCGKKKISPAVAREIWSRMETFAQYGFNKAHAASYGMISFRTAYLKAHHPKEYMAALLSSEMGNQEKIALYVRECRELGLLIQPPDARFSGPEFLPARNGIRFALAAIKHVGLNAARSIAELQAEEGPFRSLEDFCRRVDSRQVNRKALESLIRAGAFDWTSHTRAGMVLALDEIMASASAYQRDREMGQASLFGLSAAEGKSEDQSDRPAVIPAVDEFSDQERLADEQELTGLALSENPLARHAEAITLYSNATARELKEGRREGTVRLGGMLKKVRRHRDQKGETLAAALLEDLTEIIEIFVPAGVYHDHGSLLKEGQAVLVEGRVEETERGVRVSAGRIMDVEEGIAVSESPVHLYLNTVGLSAEVLDEMGRLLEEAEEGGAPLYLHLRTMDQKEVTVAPAGHRAAFSAGLLEKLKKLLGEEAVYIQRPLPEAKE